MHFYNGNGLPKFICFRLDHKCSTHYTSPWIRNCPEVRNPGSVIETQKVAELILPVKWRHWELNILANQHQSIRQTKRRLTSVSLWSFRAYWRPTRSLNYADSPDDTSEEVPEVTFYKVNLPFTNLRTRSRPADHRRCQHTASFAEEH